MSEINNFEVTISKEIPRSFGRLNKIHQPENAATLNFFKLGNNNNFLQHYDDGTFIFQTIDTENVSIQSNKNFEIVYSTEDSSYDIYLNK